MWKRLRQILEMIRFSHTIFALPFALLAAVMAWRTQAAQGQLHAADIMRQLFGVVVCMVGARSAAMAFNRIVDAKYDAENPRTANRHLPRGELSPQNVILFTIVAALIFFAGALIFLPNILPIVLAPLVLLFLFTYSYTKRFTALAHFWLGAALMLAPVCAWIAIRGEAVLASPSDLAPALWLGVAVLLWVAGFDIIYATQDREFDITHRLNSVPAKVGVVWALRVAAACHCGMIAALVALPLFTPSLQLGWIYGFSVACVASLLFYEHAIIHPEDLTRVNIAFFDVNAIVSIGLFLAASLDLMT